MDEYKKDLEDYFCRFTFGQFVTLILLEIVTLFFVFYLGARYGSDLLGNRPEVAKETYLPKQGPQSVDDIVGKPSVDYTYPEVLTSPDGARPDGKSASGGAIRVKPSGITAEEFEKQRRDAALNQPSQKAGEAEAPVQQAPQKVVPEKPVQEPQAKEVKPTPEKSPAEEAREEPVAEESPAQAREVAPSKPKGKFAVQVGSYQSESEANSTLGRWKKKGYSAFVAVGQVPDKGKWYRVRIGGFESRDEAQKFLQKLKEKEKVSALVVLSNS